MKKLLIASFLLVSISSYATTKFEETLLENEVLLQGSKNYKAKHVNDDGSITIVEPKFSDPDGYGSLSISEDSSFSGVCKLFGEGSYVLYSAFYRYSERKLVRISQDGTFGGFDSHWNTGALSFLICKPSNPIEVRPSNNAEKVLSNDDGSITIVEPKFSNPDGYGSLSISENSSLSGVCKLFGARSYVSNSASYRSKQNKLVRISQNGTFGRFDSHREMRALSSLICRY